MNTKTKTELLTEIEQLKKHISELEARAQRNRHAERNLHQIEWMLAGKKPGHADYVPGYGDLSLLNPGGLILTTVGRELLGNIASEYLDLLETSAAIYERDGSYALGLFSSGWCQMMDAASRRLCGTDDNREALQSGKWLCHESCWKNASLKSMETGQAVDIECSGGIRLYAVPVWADNDIVGSINFGYGDPPTDDNTLGELSRQFNVPMADLRRQARAYPSRPPFVIDYAKTRLEKAAIYLGTIIEREQSFQALRAGEQQLLAANQQLEASNQQLRATEQQLRAANQQLEASNQQLTASFQQLRQEKEWSQKIIDNAPNIILGLQESSKIAVFNKFAERLTGYAAQEVVGKEWISTFIPEENQETLYQTWNEIVDKPLMNHSFENEIVTKSGELRLIKWHNAVLTENNAFWMVLSVGEDITEQKALAAQFQQAQKMESVGRLLREDLTLSWQPGTVVWQVKIDPSQVDQVLMNLCVNARDAIDGTGEISIETGNKVFDPDYCKLHNGFSPGEYVMLAVSDNGCGMDKKTLDQMFEPFFTTKQVGQGSGLGLAMVYGIMKQNNGFINVYSEPGRGTTLRLYFPRDRTGIVEKTVADRQLPDAGRGETILVVEDESALLKLATRLLETLGYVVLSASHPDDALRLAKSHPGKIHLLLTDVVMPEMNGRELADRLSALYPELKRVFMSGYTANVIAHQGVLDKGMHFIQKPLSIHALAATVRQALDNK